MSGCVEDILVDLSEPVEDLVKLTRNSTGCKVDQLLNLSDSVFPGGNHINVADSVELFREEQKDTQLLIQVDSPLREDEQLIRKIEETAPSTSCSNNASFDCTPLDTIDTEKFDFDLPLTPVTVSDRSSSVEELTEDKEDDEEVFFGPMGFRERCVATVVDSATKANRPLSPLNSRQMAEIFKEANAVANRISSAVGPGKKKSVKDSLYCAKKLKLDGKTEIFSSEAVGRLLQSVDKNFSSSDADNKENSDSCRSENVLAGMDAVETDMSALVNILSENAKISKSNSSGSDEDNPDTPSRRHTRTETYTVNKVQHDKLSENKRKSLPVVSNKVNSVCDSKTSRPESETKKPGRKRSLQLPSKLVKGTSKLQGPAVKKPLVSTSPKQEPLQKSTSPKQEPLHKETNTGKESKLKPRSGLVAPKVASGLSKESALPSKLKIPGGAGAASNIPAKPGAQRSGIPGLKGKTVPVSKLQLIKPSALQRPGTVAQGKTKEAPKKTGPMKAFNPAGVKQEVEKKEEMLTPAKEEKKVKPKNLSCSFSTPNRTGSSSSLDSPMSSMKKRRSFLPTPNSSRMSSTGSAPSPCLSRGGSVSSQKSVESPLVTSGRQRRPSAGNRSTSKNGLPNFDDSSPSSMKPRKPPVTNTPNMPPKRKISPWSPVIKQRLDLEDQVIMCTKKLRKN